MANYFDNGLLAMEKSLRDVVLPALDKSDPLAREQLNLAIDYLGFLRQRLDQAGNQLRFELEFYIDMVSRLVEVAGTELDCQQISRVLSQSKQLSTNVGAEPSQLRDAITALATACDDLIARGASFGDDKLRSRIDRVVHGLSGHWIDEELAWYAPIAVDPDAPGLKPLASFYPYRSQD